MVISAISSVSFKSNRSNLKNKNNEENHFSSEPQRSGRSMAKVPVMVLMAMSPSLLNAEEPVYTINPNSIEITENNSKAEKANYAVFPGVDGIEQSKYPFGWARLDKNDEKILFSAPATGNGKSYTLVFTQTTGEEDPKKVSFVYLIANDGTVCDDWEAKPGSVEALIYHDLGKQDEYCGLKVSTGIVKNRKWTGITKTEEIRIDDKTAQRIIDFLADDSGWNNDTYLFFKQTKSRKLLNF